MVHENEKMSLPCAFEDCPRSLHFTLLKCERKNIFYTFSYKEVKFSKEKYFLIIIIKYFF